MFRVFVDTCVWRHWFTFNANKERMSSALQRHCESFSEIYCLFTSSAGRAAFLFNACIQLELGERYEAQFNRLVLPFAEKVPIPLTRSDGAYSYDGSFLMGGKTGGSLKDLLVADGRPHESEIADAAEALIEGEGLFETKPRRREFDIEHMESALEAAADLFLTNDESTILAPLQRLSQRYAPTHPMNLMNSIAKTPSVALQFVRERLGA